MATTYSANARLQKPGVTDRQWDLPINANTDAIDAMTAIGSLVVTTTETPSTALKVRVAAGTFIQADGTVGVFAGSNSLAVPGSSTTYLWLDGSGTLASGSAFPASAHLRLAHVVAGSNSVLQVVDERVQCKVAGAELSFVLKTGDTINGPLTVAAPNSGPITATLLVADPTSQVLGFFGIAPATQTPALTPLRFPAGLSATDTLADVGGSFSQATLNNNFASLAVKVDALIAALQRHGLMAS